MKSSIMAVTAIGTFALALNLLSGAIEGERTIVGEGACGKCILKETKECQHTITTEEGGKKVTYFLTQNDVDKRFGNQLCAEKKKVKATGVVKDMGDKHELTPSKIELVKD